MSVVTMKQEYGMSGDKESVSYPDQPTDADRRSKQPTGVFVTCRSCSNLIPLKTIPSVFKDNVCPQCLLHQAWGFCGCSVSFVLLFILAAFYIRPVHPKMWLWIACLVLFLVSTKIASWLNYGILIAIAPLIYALTHSIVIGAIVFVVALYVVSICAARRTRAIIAASNGIRVARMKELLAAGADSNGR